MREAKLTINLMKSEFGKARVKYLGHIVGQGQVRPLDAKSRCFEPGDRILVLFPVVGNPLQAKYSGPYNKVVKKISDTNYLVKTPGRRKETQVCHINMLKAYHEKPIPE